MAPAASIDLVEANGDSGGDNAYEADLLAAVHAAANLPGVSVVSMSWVFPEMSTDPSITPFSPLPQAIPV